MIQKAKATLRTIFTYKKLLEIDSSKKGIKAFPYAFRSSYLF